MGEELELFVCCEPMDCTRNRHRENVLEQQKECADVLCLPNSDRNAHLSDRVSRPPPHWIIDIVDLINKNSAVIGIFTWFAVVDLLIYERSATIPVRCSVSTVIRLEMYWDAFCSLLSSSRQPLKVPKRERCS